jgi:TATA-binding protein-associated factor Taf7
LLTVHASSLQLPLLQVKTKSHVCDGASRSCVDDGDGGDAVAQENGEQEEEEEDEEEEEYDDDEDELSEGHGGAVDSSSPPHGGVSARALERRLHELLQRRQQDRIVQLEAALDGAQRRLQEREREVVWWRDAAKLVSHRRDESRRLRCAAAS